MRFSAVSLVALALTSNAFLARVVAAQSAPPARTTKPAPKPVAALPTTFAAVHDGKHAAGKAVDFPVVVLPETAIQNKSGGTITYYLLAVRKDGPYLKAVEALLAEVKGPGGEMMREIPTVLGDDRRYKQLSGGLDDLLKRAFDVKLGPEETIAVEVPGFEAVASAYDWETVIDPKARPSWLTPLDPITPYRSPYAFSIDAPGVRRDIINMTLERPPNIDQSLPQMNLSPTFKFSNQSDLDNFNAAVELYNAELQRRRGYIAERTQADLQLALDRLEFRLGQAEETLSATVIASPSLATQTFSRIYKGKLPAAFVRERGKPAASLARRALAGSAVQICSYPTGASVRLDGREVGVTPYVARSLPAPSKLSILLAAAGLPSHEVVETVPMKPSGVKRFEYNLVTTKPRLLSADEGKRLFDPGFKPAQPFTLAISNPGIDPPGSKSKKDVARFLEAMRKSVSAGKSNLPAWYRPVAGGAEADVIVEIVAIQPSERKSKYDTVSTHRVRARLAGDAADGGVVDDIKPSSSGGDGEQLLWKLVERLKNERWQRALGVE